VTWKETLKRKAEGLRADIFALHLAVRRPDVPWYAKAVAVAVVAYALSPIDLIPDFIPVFGYLDELIILPLGIALVVKLIPPELMAEHRARAAAVQDRPVSFAAAAMIVVVWLAALALCALAVRRYF